MAGRGLGSLTLDLVLRTGGFTAGLDKAGRDLDNKTRLMQKRLLGLQKNAEVIGRGIGIALAAGFGVLSAGIKNAIDQADHLNDLNQRLGISAEALSGWAYVAKQTGTDIDGLAIGLKKFAKNIAEAVDAGSGSGKLFAALDISPIDAATGKLQTLENLLPQIADKFKGLHDETLKAALAQELFGKSGTDMIEFLDQGSAGIEKMREKLREMGGELDQNMLSAADEFNDQLGDLKTSTDALFTAIAADLLPDLIDLVKAFKENYTEGAQLKNTALEIAGGIRGVATAASLAVESIQAMTNVVVGLFQALSGLSKLSLPGWLANKLSGGTSASENFRNAASTLDTLKQLHENALGQLGFANAPDTGGTAGYSRGPSSRGGTHHAATNEAAIMKVLANETEHKAKADHSAADAAREHAKEMEELRKKVEETIQAHADFETHAQDLADELAGPAAQALTEYTRKLVDLTLEGQKGKATTEELAAAQANLTAAYLKDKQAIEDRLNTGKKVLEDLQFQIDLTNMATDAERQRAQFMHDNATATQADADAYVRMMKEFKESNEAIGAADEFRGHWEDAFASILDGSKSVKEAFGDLAKSILADIARMLAHKWVEQLFGGYGTQMGGGSSGGGWGSLISALFSSKGAGGDSALSFNSSAFGDGYANGTDFAPGGLAWVGERGRELVNLPRGSQVIPNHKLGHAGGMNVTNNFTLAAPTERRTQNQIAARIAFETRRATVRA